MLILVFADYGNVVTLLDVRLDGAVGAEVSGGAIVTVFTYILLTKTLKQLFKNSNTFENYVNLGMLLEALFGEI